MMLMLRQSVLLVTWILATPATALAAESVVPETDLFQVISSLVAVVVLIFLLAWGVKRVQSGSAGPGGAIQVVAALALGTRERVVLIQVGDEQILVGVGPGGMRTLHVLDHPLEAQPGVSGQSAFARRLRDMLGGNAQ